MPVLGLYESPHGDVLSAAFRAGAFARGWTVRRRSANDYKRGDTEPFDLCFLYSLRSRGADELLRGFAHINVPVVVTDYGYVKRACQEAFGGGGEYWQVGIGGLNSIPQRFGIARALWISRALHALMFLALLWIYLLTGLHSLGLLGIIATAALLVYQHRLVRADDLSRLNMAFFTTNAYVSIILFLTIAADVFLFR